MNVAAFLKLPNGLDYPLSKPDYFRSYQELSQEVERLGSTFYIVREQNTYEGGGWFTKSWRYQGDQLVETGRVQIAALYDKGDFISDGQIKVFNEEYVHNVCTDKWLMYQLFTQYCPKTWLVTNRGELEKGLAEVTTDVAVIKPVDGGEGHGVFIGPKAELLNKEVTYPLLLQEFIDTSGGLPGIVEGLHDFRVAIFNGEILYAYYRTPPGNSYLANVSRGGRFEMVKPARIPPSIKDIVAVIDAELARCPQRFYGIDFGMSPNGPLIIEMNSKLGLLPNSDGEVFHLLKQKIAQTLVSLK